jgi:hypothetical protein
VILTPSSRRVKHAPFSTASLFPRVACAREALPICPDIGAGQLGERKLSKDAHEGSLALVARDDTLRHPR